MKGLRTTIVVCLLFIAVSPFAARAANVSPEQIRALAEEATIWGYPIVQNYKGTYFACVLKQSPVYFGFNTLHHERRLYTPENRIIVSPNNDTPYSTATLDLRAEPLVLSVPDMGDRYYTFQLVDMATNNFAYIGTRATGNKAGKFALAGPDWKGTLLRGEAHPLPQCLRGYLGTNPVERTGRSEERHGDAGSVLPGAAEPVDG